MYGRSLQKERKSLNAMEVILRANSNTIEQARAANIQNWRIYLGGMFGAYSWGTAYLPPD